MKTPFADLKYIFVTPKEEYYLGTFVSAIPVKHNDYSGDIYEVTFYIEAWDKTLSFNKALIYQGDSPILIKKFSEVTIGRGFIKNKPPYHRVPGETLTIQWYLQYVEDSTEIIFIQPI